MCGGDSESLEKVKPIMEKYTRGVRLCGGPGQGQQTKLTNQIIIANNIAGTVEGLLYASKIGLDLHLTVDTIAVGGASSNVLTWLGHKMADGDDDAGVTV
jgi:3-hydroxyisobutyrate dehydrogenase